MAVQYNKLWKRLIDMKIKKSSLTEMAKLQDQIGQNEKLHQVKGNEGIYEVNC